MWARAVLLAPTRAAALLRPSYEFQRKRLGYLVCIAGVPSLVTVGYVGAVSASATCGAIIAVRFIVDNAVIDPTHQRIAVNRSSFQNSVSPAKQVAVMEHV